ncbi:unnamed protein product [Candidula unifasciata]|uniref:Transmembrane protein n=1 Tax=Candidula unifasciata TaxID=100452 RepID=A0A8S3YHJ4_9EUPU|nr:unnamed protein product [Candidula unifasciata]
MTRSIICVLSFLISQAAGSYYCLYDDGLTTDYVWCTWGCCDNGLLEPCCDQPLYAGTPFIAGLTCGSVALVCAVIGILIYRRRRYNTTTVQYGPTVQPHVFSSTTSTSSHAGYSNPGFTSTTQAYY